MKRFLKLHQSLTVPEDGTVIEASQRPDGTIGVEIFCAGHTKSWVFTGDVASAILAFMNNLQSFPTTVVNGRETVDIPYGWQQSLAARGMMAQQGKVGEAFARTGLGGNTYPQQAVALPPLPVTAPAPATWEAFVAPEAKADLMPLQAVDVPMIDEKAVQRALRGEMYD